MPRFGGRLSYPGSRSFIQGAHCFVLFQGLGVIFRHFRGPGPLQGTVWMFVVLSRMVLLQQLWKEMGGWYLVATTASPPVPSKEGRRWVQWANQGSSCLQTPEGLPKSIEPLTSRLSRGRHLGATPTDRTAGTYLAHGRAVSQSGSVRVRGDQGGSTRHCSQEALK